jgi:hypothetical protein
VFQAAFVLLAKYRQMAKNSRILNLGKKLIAEISSNLTIFHPFEQIFINL